MLTEREYYTWDKQGELGHIGVRKVTALVLGLLLLALPAFGQVFEEKVSYQVEVTESGHVQVRKATRIFKDGKEVGKTYHRHVLSPGDDLTNEVPKAKKIAEAIWTPELIKEFKDKQKKERIPPVSEPVIEVPPIMVTPMSP